jgi:HEPN domain-containing protein
MSQSKNLHEAKRWLQTAQEDLEAAQSLSSNGFFAQACFFAQQCGEKTLKALWYLYDHEPWGHSIQRLVTEFPDISSLPDYEDWIQRAASLDRYYIPTRYPNGLPDLTPAQSYFKQDAESAIAHAIIFLLAARKVIT